MPDDAAVIPDSTYMGDVRHFFTTDDHKHMALYDIDLSTYAGVRAQAINIFFMTAPPDPQMPPPPYPPWSPERSQTFKNWMANGYPLGRPTPGPAAVAEAPPGARVRKDVTTLTAPELEALSTAFQGLMDREPSDPNGYFLLAAIHGMPEQYCLHHVDPFQPWHRVYMKAFEDQLRTIPGCEEVTLPYWDISTPLPDVLQQPPFDKYSLPHAVAGFDQFPYTTSRYAPEQITKNLHDRHVLEELAKSVGQGRWGSYNSGGFQKLSMQAHDGGHDSIGPTMADQDVASYDPVFWFYHANVDRMWLQWQKNVGAETLPGFKSTLDGDVDWLTPPLNALPPLDGTSDETITYAIVYDPPATPAREEAVLENKTGSIEAARGFTIERSSPVSVRVKGIDRLAIPGTFRVNLLADGERIATRSFFQPSRPKGCATCATIPLVNIDFRLDADEILDKKLSVEIDAPRLAEAGTTRFPLSHAGNPTINVRFLVDEA
jgi:hypothetical protein